MFNLFSYFSNTSMLAFGKTKMLAFGPKKNQPSMERTWACRSIWGFQYLIDHCVLMIDTCYDIIYCIQSIELVSMKRIEGRQDTKIRSFKEAF